MALVTSKKMAKSIVKENVSYIDMQQRDKLTHLKEFMLHIEDDIKRLGYVPSQDTKQLMLIVNEINQLAHEHTGMVNIKYKLGVE